MRRLCRGLGTDQGLLEALHGGNATGGSDAGDGGSEDRPEGGRGRRGGGGEDGRNDVLVAVGGGGGGRELWCRASGGAYSTRASLSRAEPARVTLSLTGGRAASRRRHVGNRCDGV